MKKTLIPSALQQAWQQRNPREQRLLLMMAVVLGAALLYAAVWEPAAGYVAKNRGRLAALQAELAFDQTLAAEAARLKAQPAVTPMKAADLTAVVKQALQTRELAPESWQLQPDGDWGLQLSGQADFGAWLGLQADLAAQQVRVVRLKATASDKPGHVAVQALLAHAGAEP